MSFSGSCAMWSVPRSQGELIHRGISQPVTTTELSAVPSSEHFLGVLAYEGHTCRRPQ